MILVLVGRAARCVHHDNISPPLKIFMPLQDSRSFEQMNLEIRVFISFFLFFSFFFLGILIGSIAR